LCDERTKKGEIIVNILTDSNANILKNFEDKKKPSVLTEEEQKSVVDQDIYREEFKSYVKDLKVLKLNLKKLYSLVYGNCTDSVKTIIKTDDEYEKRSKSFNCAWLLRKVKTTVSGIDTKTNLRVSLHAVIFIFCF